MMVRLASVFLAVFVLGQSNRALAYDPNDVPSNMSVHMSYFDSATAKLLLWEQGHPLTNEKNKYELDQIYTSIGSNVDQADDLTMQLIEQERVIDHMYLWGIKDPLLKAFAGWRIQDDVPSWDCFIATRDKIQSGGSLKKAYDNMLAKYGEAQQAYGNAYLNIDILCAMDAKNEPLTDQLKATRDAIDLYVEKVDEFVAEVKACQYFLTTETSIKGAVSAYQSHVAYNSTYMQWLVEFGYDYCE